jgi:DNA-binding response OmpR family regulator
MAPGPLFAMTLHPPSDKAWGVLVVDDNLETLRFILDLLRRSGYNATGAVHVDVAASIVHVIPFDLMVIALPARASDALNLIDAARTEQPGMAIIAIAAGPDAEIERQCAELGAAVLVRPLDLPRLEAIVAEKVSHLGRQRRWARKPVTGGFAARVGGADATIVDISYGGCRLELPETSPTAVSSPVEVTLLSFGLSVKATVVWTRPVETGPWTCGAAIGNADEDTIRAWRMVVDALPAGALVAGITVAELRGAELIG